MSPESAAAVRIAEKHLAGASAERQKALALDIAEAIVRNAGSIVTDLLSETIANVSKPRH